MPLKREIGLTNYSVLKISSLNTSTKVSTNLSGTEKEQGLEIFFFKAEGT